MLRMSPAPSTDRTFSPTLAGPRTRYRKIRKWCNRKKGKKQNPRGYSVLIIGSARGFYCVGNIAFLSSRRPECPDPTRASRRPFYPIYDKSSKSYNSILKYDIFGNNSGLCFVFLLHWSHSTCRHHRAAKEDAESFVLLAMRSWEPAGTLACV